MLLVGLVAIKSFRTYTRQYLRIFTTVIFVLTYQWTGVHVVVIVVTVVTVVTTAHRWRDYYDQYVLSSLLNGRGECTGYYDP